MFKKVFALLAISILLLAQAPVKIVDVNDNPLNPLPTTSAGGAAAGAAPSGSPVQVAGTGSGPLVIVPYIWTSANGGFPTGVANTGQVLNANIGTVQDGSAASGTGYLWPVPHGLYDGVNARNSRSASLSNFPTSVTTTARNSVGAALVEKGSRWSVFSNPAAPTIASASIAAEASVRHVVDCIAFSAANGTALTPALATVNLRDGASGAGTVLWTYEFWLLAGPGQAVAPHSVCGLNLVGTTNTAMTLEFNAGVTNLTESTSISGYNVN